MRHVALIPARGGSSGIKDKNLQLINGESLVKIAWRQCVTSEIFDKVILSTDSENIAREITNRFDFDVLENDSYNNFSDLGILHKRIPQDSTSQSLVSLLSFKIAQSFDIEYLWIIQPTSPFRYFLEFHSLNIITQSLQNWSSIVSVKDAETIHPNKMFYLNNYLTPIMNSNFDESHPRQKLPKVYIKDGSFYVLKGKNLVEKTFLGDKILPFIRKNEMNVNIDLPEDLEIAKFLSLFYPQNKF